ncbi:uncharacterized protein LOC132319997 [Gavia stellata]|uniref:uncharacterized protein LOC132319997 n=1 Tax=Gavia stellata TaxID=37040 RepID=UPI0028A22339|nr:uncharacterized protein LOC132319997 [Gavia stellata]
MGGRSVCLFGVALLAVAVSFAAQAQLQQVNGVLGGSVLLSPALPPNKMVKEIEWSFSDSAGAAVQVAEFGPGGFERPDPKDRFKDRLEMFNEMALKIGALERGDSGVYGARIKLYPVLVEDQFFNLSVYEPLRDPKIQSWLLSKSPAWCHLMLQCHVPSGTGGTVTWMELHGEPRGVRVHPLCSGVLHVVVQPGSPNTTLTCRAWHALEERSQSIDLASVCWSGGTSLTIMCQELQTVPTASQSQTQGAALAAARASRNDDLGSDPVSFP